jgi:hypothetical protein
MGMIFQNAPQATNQTLNPLIVSANKGTAPLTSPPPDPSAAGTSTIPGGI